MLKITFSAHHVAKYTPILARRAVSAGATADSTGRAPSAVAAGGAGDAARSLRTAAAAVKNGSCRYRGRAETERESGRWPAATAGRGGRWRGLNTVLDVAAADKAGDGLAEAAVPSIVVAERVPWVGEFLGPCRRMVGACGGGCVVCDGLMAKGRWGGRCL
uniref:Uncharacterized protein n=1 Tax=Arundo donax TaxID=35708 RepID=A0A0A9AHZ8_ARUDO